MSSLSRDLIDAALAADLSKNEYKVFLALFRQALAGLPLDASTQAHRQALVSEFNTLKAQMQEGQA